jgi:hypothetical protein
MKRLPANAVKVDRPGLRRPHCRKKAVAAAKGQAARPPAIRSSAATAMEVFEHRRQCGHLACAATAVAADISVIRTSPWRGG